MVLGRVKVDHIRYPKAEAIVRKGFRTCQDCRCGIPKSQIQIYYGKRYCARCLRDRKDRIKKLQQDIQCRLCRSEGEPIYDSTKGCRKLIDKHGKSLSWLIKHVKVIDQFYQHQLQETD